MRLLVFLFALSSSLLAAAPPNILLILVDDMGYGDPRCFNPESKIATPHIDKLAAEGMRFTDAHAGGSICVPSRYSVSVKPSPFEPRLTWRARATHRRLSFGPVLGAGRLDRWPRLGV